ncbi:hypothetical protein D9619_001341 [Psilocybe cf. subviscida]|uniref:Cytochrome P450 n=1 Tax=Psilocybe cf. subviscida TaxID=2480587 RepID=A0A8H5BGG7_9AGAR|nr:hypothetical protein D9619_001341 [Psilocybe cf. subviscida]
MMPAMSLVLYGVIALLFASISKRVVDYLCQPRRVSYPPGPKPKPLIGNMLDLPTSYGAQEYLKWSKKYNSDILFASALGSNLLILNHPEDADELFQRRAARYSDRPAIPILKLLGWDPAMVSLLRYGDIFRLHRKIMQQCFHQEESRRYQPIIQSKVNKLLLGLLETPEEFAHHNRMSGISIPMAMMYGYSIESIHDPFIEAAEKCVQLGAPLLTPGGSLINLFPILAKIPPWVPGAASQKTAVEVRRLTALMQNIPLNLVTKQFGEGVAPQSVIADFLEKKACVGASAEEEEAMKNIAFSIYGAAADTTISATGTFIYQMCINPKIQRKAQAEIESVVGSSRLPTWNDRKSLPYVEAIYREVLRWRPPLLLGIPHTSTEDDYYKGYFIPKGTAVIGNIWGMTHNDAVYSEPYEFIPERFLNEDGQLKEEDTFVYGGGKRICVGQHIASSTVWFTMVSILACFSIDKAKNEIGEYIDISDDYDHFGTISFKSPYKCLITRRGPHIPDTIKEAIHNTS